MQRSEVLHYPSLKTILMVEDVLKKADNALTREQLKKKLKNKVMHQTLNVVLDYLSESGKILDSRKGIVWIYTTRAEMEKLKRGAIVF